MAAGRTVSLSPSFPSPFVRRSRATPQGRAFRKTFFPEVTDSQWNDWRWQSRNRIRAMAQLEAMLVLSGDERDALTARGSMLPMGITPYYMSLISRDDPLQPLRRTVIPTSAEAVRAQGEDDDPLDEDKHSPVPGLVHRYPDRVLLLVLGYCSTYCRYCTRSRIFGRQHQCFIDTDKWEKALDYIKSNPNIRDVLLSGGDPLTLPDDKLEWLLSRLKDIPHVELVRIGTKAPVVLPQRISPTLVSMLKKYHPLWMSIHITHPDELTPEMSAACIRLADAGIPLGSQTVLLAGINDSVSTMTRLVHGLLQIRVRPYYLYQCDPIPGSSHFRTPISKGLEIIQGLRGHTTGYAVPTYVVDAPGGGGKIPLLPEYATGWDKGDLMMRNYEGNIFRYPDNHAESKDIH
jgi:lysine 2,3-aminomutase